MTRLASLALVAGLASLALACEFEHSQPGISTSRAAALGASDEDLEDAIALYEKSAAEHYIFATDPGEAAETLVGERYVSVLSDNGQFDDIFNIGDEAFEAEHNRVTGFGQGAPPLPGQSAVVQRIHTGERGGADSSSCRACHFAGGPDGAGAATQAGLFRGDGRYLSSATVRDAPHVMGLGYISILARQFEDRLAFLRDDTAAFAVQLGEPYERELVVQGVSFGIVVGLPDGTADLSGVRGIGRDLKVRPFGHKGRHRTLSQLVDEALQVHHGLQSEGRVDLYDDGLAEEYLGSGQSRFDRDDDGVESEVSYGQAVLGASYLSMLGTPTIRPPADAELALAWARGSRVFDDVQCGTCHTRVLRIDSYVTQIDAVGASGLSVTLDLLEVGQDPIPRLLDNSPNEEGTIPHTVPVFPFTDLRRHDMGEELAELVPEALPDRSGSVPGSVWLTRSLWGLADTAPYLHDGRAPTVHEAIVAHGGEGAASRDAYLALGSEDRASLRTFLMSLTRDPVLLVE